MAIAQFCFHNEINPKYMKKNRFNVHKRMKNITT